MESPIKSPSGTPGGAAPYATVWDQRTRKYRNVLIQVTLFILVMELAERLSYYGINQGLRNFMRKIGWSNVKASALKSTWTSVCYMSPIFGAYLADERWGRFRTILTFGVWYCVGDFMVAISAYPDVMTNKDLVNPLFVIGLFVGIGIGTGAIKSNVITLGADQFDPNDENEVAQKKTFFSYFYFCINAGACVSYGYFSTLSVDGSSLIPKEYGYFAVFLICAVVMFFAIGILLIGYPRYVHMAPTDKALSGFVRLVLNNAGLTTSGAVLLWSTVCFFISFFVNIIAAFTASKDPTGEIFSYVAGGFCLIGIVGWIYVGLDTSFLEASKISRGGSFDDERVDGYRRLVRVLPFAAFTIIWHCTYDQTDANFQAITQQCDLRLDTSDPESDQVPGAMLGVFDPLVIVICIPVLETMVYPAFTKHYGKPPTQFGRVLSGLILATIGVGWSGIFEILRRNSDPLVGPDGGPILDNGGEQPMNHMYWVGAIPNYVFVALGECLINVTAYDVFYSSVPLSLKSSSQAVNLLMICMGSIMTSVFTIMFKPYVTDDLNEGNIEYMFFTICGVSLLNTIAFVVVMKKMNFGFQATSNDSDDIDGKEGIIARESISSMK